MAKISVKESMAGSYIYIDVRSENEFKADHIPNSINMPILDNEERHIVGYTYTRVDKDKAMSIGMDIFKKKVSQFEDKIKEFQGKKIIFYCARGGFRSGVFVEHFNNPDILQLENGYKGYRNFILNNLNKIKLPKAIVLHGLTGCGKTDIIKLLDNAIDLEGLAQHRSSLYGEVGKTPRTQKMFETLLYFELQKIKDYVIFEGESRKIGDIILPKNVFDAMESGIRINIVSDLKYRCQRILKEYFSSEENIKEIIEITPKLKSYLGTKKTDNLIHLLKTKEYLEFIRIILEEYYDPRYNHSIKEMTFSKEINIDDFEKALDEIKKFAKTV